MVGRHLLVIRDCTNLVQIDLVIKVLNNTAPFLKDQPIDLISINTGGSFNFTLSDPIDSENNDELD